MQRSPSGGPHFSRGPPERTPSRVGGPPFWPTLLKGAPLEEYPPLRRAPPSCGPLLLFSGGPFLEEGPPARRAPFVGGAGRPFYGMDPLFSRGAPLEVQEGH